jgi:hypothetical protein
MVVAHFLEGGAAAVYRRFAEKGRMMPEGLRYVESWVASDLMACYQLMETDDIDLFAEWTRHWDDLIEFEIVPIISSAEASSRMRVES